MFISRLAEMDMEIDKAGHDKYPPGIDALRMTNIYPCSEMRFHAHNNSLRDQEIGLGRTGAWSYNPSAVYQDHCSCTVDDRSF